MFSLDIYLVEKSKKGTLIALLFSYLCQTFFFFAVSKEPGNISRFFRLDLLKSREVFPVLQTGFAKQPGNSRLFRLGFAKEPGMFPFLQTGLAKQPGMEKMRKSLKRNEKKLVCYEEMNQSVLITSLTLGAFHPLVYRASCLF